MNSQQNLCSNASIKIKNITCNLENLEIDRMNKCANKLWALFVPLHPTVTVRPLKDILWVGCHLVVGSSYHGNKVQLPVMHFQRLAQFDHVPGADVSEAA